MSFNFIDFPTLKTKRLVLRELSFNDIDAIYRLRSNENVNKLITRKIPENLKEAEEFITVCHQEFKNKNRIFWVIEFHKKLIGTIVFHRISIENNYAEIGYELNPKYRNKGYMNEAMKTVLSFGFDKLSLKTIEAFTHKNNMASIALLEKHNFVLQTERKCNSVADNRIWKLEKMSSTSSD